MAEQVEQVEQVDPVDPVRQVTSRVGRMGISSSSSKFDQDLEPLLSVARFVALFGPATSDDLIEDEMVDRLSVKTAKTDHWVEQGERPERRTGLSPRTTQLRLLTWFTLESNRSHYCCHATRYPFGLLRMIEFAHLIPRSTEPSELALLERVLGMKPGSFNVHSRLNLIPVHRTVHALIDFCRVFFLPDTVTLEKLTEYLLLVGEEAEKEEKEEMEAKKKGPSQGSLWSRLREGNLPGYEELVDANFHSYRIVAVGVQFIQPKQKGNENEDDMFQNDDNTLQNDGSWNPARGIFLPRYSDSASAPEMHAYPYHHFPPFESHVSPFFVTINAARTMDEIFTNIWSADPKKNVYHAIENFWKKTAKEPGHDQALSSDEIEERRAQWNAFKQFANVLSLQESNALRAQASSSRSGRSTRSSQRSGSSFASGDRDASKAPSKTDTPAPGDDRPSTPTPKGGSHGKKKGLTKAVGHPNAPSNHSPATLIAKEWQGKNGYTMKRPDSKKYLRWPKFLLPIVKGVRKGMDRLPVPKKVIGGKGDRA